MTFRRVVDVIQVLVLVGAAVFVLALFLNDGSSSPGASAPTGEVDGATVYQESCQACHGLEGQGLVGPALGGGAAVEAYPDRADQVVVVTDGLPNGMPGFGTSLTPEEIEAVVDYTRNDL